jgi:hypothetical protein
MVISPYQAYRQELTSRGPLRQEVERFHAEFYDARDLLSERLAVQLGRMVQKLGASFSLGNIERYLQLGLGVPLEVKSRRIEDSSLKLELSSSDGESINLVVRQYRELRPSMI